MSADSEVIDEVCPYCGEAVIERQDDGNYWCPACGSSFAREDIEEAVDLEDEDDLGGDVGGVL